MLANEFWEWLLYMGPFPWKEGGIQVLGGEAPSSQTEGSLLRTLWLVKPAAKIVKTYFINIQSVYFFCMTKKMFPNFTIWKLSPNSFVPGIILRPYHLPVSPHKQFARWGLLVYGDDTVLNSPTPSIDAIKS
jgi:hypothetical protein